MISAHLCVAGRELTEPRLSPDGATLVHGVSFAGSAMLVLDRLDGSPPRQLTTWPPPRVGRGMFGGCWCWTPDAAVVYAAADGDLWLQPLDGGPRRLTAVPEGASASSPAAAASLVAYVVDEREVWTIDVRGGPARRLDDGVADFCFDPAPDDAGVTWVEWDVPDMPWDRTRLRRADGTGLRTIATASPAVQQPFALANGGTLHLGDGRGWLNLWLDDRPVVDEPHEHASPMWGPGQRSYAVSPDGRRVAFTRNDAGFGRLCVVDLPTGAVSEVGRGVHGQLSWAGTRLGALRTGARTPTQIAIYDTDTWERSVAAVGPAAGWDAVELAEPQPVEVRAADRAVLHARLYRADRADGRLMVWLHGGPTDQWQVTFMPRVAYWRSRGWSVLVPDHRGSTGHGREYAQALRGRWGDLDVDDTLDVVRHAHADGWGAPATTVGIGASAGGLTVLNAVRAAPELFAAAVACYPVSDLEHLAEATHRFEAHYTDSLVGPLPAARERSRRRSPVHHGAELAGTPLLLLHGTDDPVVPVQHTIALAEAIGRVGGSVELHCYEGEGHGWRRPEHQIDEYRRIAAFLDRVVGGG